ncbi:hypothetical protein ACFL4G_01580 [Thermodesulfobacteriota bacterium]
MKAFRQAISFLSAQVEGSPDTTTGRLCRDFLSLLGADPGTPEVAGARARLRDASGNPGLAGTAALLLEGADAVIEEVDEGLGRDGSLGERLRQLGAKLSADGSAGAPASPEMFEAFWTVFCPQAAGIRGHWEEKVRDLRDRRSVRVESLCPDPLRRPAEEILFTSNALLTLPPEIGDPGTLNLEEGFRRRLEAVMGESQAFWYDHPVQIGTRPESNEILYGLRGLAEMLRFEKSRGNADPGDRLTVALSASVTHPGLKDLARDYIEGEVTKSRDIEGLDIHVFTEKETESLVEDFLCPAARLFGLEGGDPSFFSGVFGVDGAYGRHYSFLKAVAALWHVTVDRRIRATFKIDLDQVFPQETLVRETGQSAFDLFRSPLWGADGRDSAGRPVSLGMIAGALVNNADIDKGIFTPDVTLPEVPLPPDRFVFASRLPQALSTEAEMMTRYGDGRLDGHWGCLSRIHVTGGTVGIRVDSLRRHRPFSLSWFGRAEDQSYIMSSLFGPGPTYLRYAHMPGLIMRHDKQAFAGEAIRAAAAGKAVGDYERMLLFSGYAKALPWPLEETKSTLDPFTGCFILALPVTTALLCLVLKVLSLDRNDAKSPGLEAESLLQVGAARLRPLVEASRRDPDWIRESYEKERSAWDAYYDILEHVEKGMLDGNARVEGLARRAKSIVRQTRIDMK